MRWLLTLLWPPWRPRRPRLEWWGWRFERLSCYASVVAGGDVVPAGKSIELTAWVAPGGRVVGILTDAVPLWRGPASTN